MSIRRCLLYLDFGEPFIMVIKDKLDLFESSREAISTSALQGKTRNIAISALRSTKTLRYEFKNDQLAAHTRVRRRETNTRAIDDA